MRLPDFHVFSFILYVYFQTALHWAAKHGNEDVVKLIAGTRKADVNAKTVIKPLRNKTFSIFQILY